ncbi:unnamed protein product [Haemonchus placei]|uniref:SEM1 26S proteasome complex subunit n=1 Tax=Haemonchus placei TaxID=6290 RepID=A0A0N4W297_HAEPC|nr:unnamed protein product [Haemonchus placei]
MSIPDIDMEDFNGSFDNWLLDSAPSVVPDTDDSDAEIPDDDFDEGAENTWYDEWTFSEPIGTNLEADNCETPLQFSAVFL